MNEWQESELGQTAIQKWSEYGLPDDMLDSMLNWIEHGIMPADFLCAVLSNDLHQAASRADDINIYKFREYNRWLYNYAPAFCWRSQQNFETWEGIAKHVGSRSSPLARGYV